MTREEQIIEKASKDSEIYYKVNDNYGDCFHGGFIDGAKWADEHPKPEMVNKQEFMEKAVKYLEANFPDIENVGSAYKKSFINNFRKAMGE